jgi:hypothetical protein
MVRYSTPQPQNMALTIQCIDARHTYGSSHDTTKDHGSNQYNSAGAGSDIYGSGTGAGYESGAHHGSNMGTGNYGTGNATGGYSSGTHHDSSMDRMNGEYNQPTPSFYWQSN